MVQTVKHLPTMQETRVWSLGREDLLEKEMATHSCTLAWRIPWTEEPGGLQSTESQRVGQDWATSLTHTSELQYRVTRRVWFPVTAEQSLLFFSTHTAKLSIQWTLKTSIWTNQSTCWKSLWNFNISILIKLLFHNTVRHLIRATKLYHNERPKL